MNNVLKILIVEDTPEGHDEHLAPQVCQGACFPVDPFRDLPLGGRLTEKRGEIVAFTGAFHGRSSAAIAASGAEKMVKGVLDWSQSRSAIAMGR